MDQSHDQHALLHHRIRDVSFYRVRARYPRLHGMNAQRGYHGYGGSVDIAVLDTDQGAQGWGMISGSLREASGQLPQLVGCRLGDLLQADRGILDERLRPFDLPLHDLAGKVLGLSVARMINPAAITQVRVYDGAIYMDDLIPEVHPAGIDRVVREAEDDYALGHRALKIKIGRGKRWMKPEEGMMRDIALVRAIHAALPDATLMVDANDGYTVDDCITFLEGIHGIDIYWFEEPFREAEQHNARLKAYLQSKRPTTLIADGESDTDIPLLHALAQKGLLDVWQPDICGFGFTAWRTLLHELVPLGYLASPHAWGQVLKTYYSAHLAAAYPHHIPYVEAVLGTTEGVDCASYQLRHGMLSLPNAPGFGMDFFWGERLLP